MGGVYSNSMDYCNTPWQEQIRRACLFGQIFRFSAAGEVARAPPDAPWTCFDMPNFFIALWVAPAPK